MSAGALVNDEWGGGKKMEGGGGRCGVTVLEVVRPVSGNGVETLTQLLEPGEVCLGQGLKSIEAVTGTMQGCAIPASGVLLGLRHGRARLGSAPVSPLSRVPNASSQISCE